MESKVTICPRLGDVDDAVETLNSVFLLATYDRDNVDTAPSNVQPSRSPDLASKGLSELFSTYVYNPDIFDI
jgi:hypothetical protein